MSERKLSEFQRRTLEAIDRQGGTAGGRQGGYWYGADGERLHVEPIDGSVQDSPGTSTIMSLADKGLLERTHAHVHARLDTYRRPEGEGDGK